MHTIGFSDTPNVDLDDCDVAEPDNEKKLSWFLDCGLGGYRAGVHLDLYDRDCRWEKVMYWA